MKVRLIVSKGVTESKLVKAFMAAVSIARIYACGVVRETVIEGSEVTSISDSVMQEKVVTDPMGHEKVTKEWYVNADSACYRYYEPFEISVPPVGGDELNDPDAGEAMMGVLPNYLWGFDNDPACNRNITLIDTDIAEKMHYALLPMLLVMANELGDDAYLDGDFSAFKIRPALRAASELLGKPVSCPVQFDRMRLAVRIDGLPIRNEQKYALYLQLYRGDVSSQMDYNLRERYNVQDADVKHLIKPYAAPSPDKNPNISNIDQQDATCRGVISSTEGLLYYDKGDPIAADVMQEIYSVLTPIWMTEREGEYKRIKKLPMKSIFTYLCGYSKYILLGDDDWQRIYGNLQDTRVDVLARYYLLSKSGDSSEKRKQVIRALVVNDDLYDDMQQFMQF